MEATTIPKPQTSEVELKITITAAELQPFLERAARKLAKDHPIKGFRPGKITLPVAYDSYGQDRVLHEALERALPHFFVQAVLDQDLEAIGRPTVSIAASSVTDGVAFTATVAVVPTVTLPDPRTLTVAKREVSLTEDELDHELKMLAKMRSTYLDVARPAQMGDTVTVDFKVSMNGTVMEGGESKNHPVHLGEGHFVPDFEKKLEGIQAGDTREFTIDFPADYSREELRSKHASVWVKAHAIQKHVIPELNDEFAKKLGTFASLQQLRAEFKKNLHHEKEHKEEDRFHAALAEALADKATFGPIPTVLIERETDRRLQEFSNMLGHQNKTVDDYLTQHKKTLADIRQELRDVSVKAVKTGLALRAFAASENITVSDDDVMTTVNQYLARFATTKQARATIDQNELKDSFASTLRNQKALQRLAQLQATPAPATSAEKKKP